MAIYHASTKPISRSAGRSAVAAIAYRTACRLVDERTGQVHDYRRKGGVVSTEILLPDGSSAERNALWNAAEAAEKRKDSRTAREWVIALPSELDTQQRQELAVGFAVELVTRYGVAVDLAIHLPDREGDNRNHHAHLLTTTRQVSRNESGALVMGEKAQIELGERTRRERGMIRGAEEITAIRKLWEQTANQALKQAGRAERIDARSLKAQGIEREATQHLGPTASEMERRGKQTDRGDMNRQAAANNQERAQLVAQVIDLQEQRQRQDEARKAVRREADAARRQKSKEAQEQARRARFEEMARKFEESSKQWQRPQQPAPQKPIQQAAKPVQPVQAQPAPQKAAQTPQRAVPVAQVASAVPAPQKPVQKPAQPVQAQAAKPERVWTSEEKDSLVRIVMMAAQQYRRGTITVEHETARTVVQAVIAYPGTDEDRMKRLRETLEGPNGAVGVSVLHTAAWHVTPELQRLAQEQQKQQQGPDVSHGR